MERAILPLGRHQVGQYVEGGPLWVSNSQRSLHASPPIQRFSLFLLGPAVELVGHRREVDSVGRSGARSNGLGALQRHFTPTSRVAVAHDAFQLAEAETCHIAFAASSVYKEHPCASGDGIVGHTAPHKG